MTSNRGRRTLAVAALGALIAALSPAAAALASRPATKAERAEITSLIHHDHSGDIAGPGRVKVRKIVVSTKVPWASAELAIQIPGEGADLAGALFQRRAGHYRLVRIGSDEIGCGLVSDAVARELGVGGCA